LLALSKILRLALFASSLAVGCRRGSSGTNVEAGTAELGEGQRLEASASERRLAIVVGNDVGGGERPALRYAAKDAAKMARVLEDLGHFAAGDVRLRQGQSLADLRATFSEMKELVAATKRHDPRSRALLLFYFSGHSDGAALELGQERFPIAEVRESLRQTGADVRLAILDACHSGAAIGVKGGKKSSGFDITQLGLPALSGEVFLSASRADELALESHEIEGSFFTHHLVSGLRGAADADRNALVTLEELYRHASASTSSAAAGTLFGGQTPAYDYRLVGHGDLVLADLRETNQTVMVPAGFDRVLFVRQPSGIVEVEAGLGPSLLVALPVGDYVLRGERSGKWLRATFRMDPPEKSSGITTLDFVEETPSDGSAPRDERTLPEMTRDFRPGNSFPAPLPKSNPYFCEPTEGNWKACRFGGCFVCADMLHGYPHYFRNHPNCAPNSTCKGRYFTCSSNCPPPTAADSCDPQPDGWLACNTGCTVCTLEVESYPRYFQNHPGCIPMPGRCKDGPGRCSAACPRPGPEDR
jgi:hypothetical protein